MGVVSKWGNLQNGWFSFWAPFIAHIYIYIHGCGSKPMGSHFGVFGAPLICLSYFIGDWDVHWGYDLGFDPWPYIYIYIDVYIYIYIYIYICINLDLRVPQGSKAERESWWTSRTRSRSRRRPTTTPAPLGTQRGDL